MTLDPQAAALLARIAASGIPPTHELPPAEARRLNEEGAAALFGPVETVAEVTDQEVAGVPTRIYDPAPGGSPPILVYFHGGGWVLGDYPTHRRLVRDLVVESGVTAVFPDYTPSPEAKYPVAINQAYAATKWVAEHGSAMAGGLIVERFAGCQ